MNMENQIKNTPEDTPKSVVRLATLKDFDWCVKLAIEAVKEIALVEPDYPMLLNHIWASLNLDHGLMGVIGEEGGVLEGGVMLRIGQMWYSSESILEEKVVFVHQDFRSAKGGRAKLLSEWCKAKSVELGLPLFAGVMTTERSQGKMKLFERMFGPPAGAFFLYNDKSGKVMS